MLLRLCLRTDRNITHTLEAEQLGITLRKVPGNQQSLGATLVRAARPFRPMSGCLSPSLLRSRNFNRVWTLSSVLNATPSNPPHFASPPSWRTARLPSPCPITSRHHLPKPDKWGTVIYRCTYKDDQAWSRFKQKLQTETRETVEFYKRTTEPVAENHQWRLIENRALLDGASKAQLRSLFKQ